MDKTVLITGADGNLGKVVINKLLEKGYQIIAVAGMKYKEGLPENKKLEVIKADIGNEANTQNIVATLINKYDKIDAALLLAGGFAMGKISGTGIKELNEMLQTNFFTAYNIARPLFDYMLNRGNGRIVFISARSSYQVSEGKNAAAYALSKGLLNHFVQLLNASAGNKNVIASIVAPSIIDTPINRKAMPEADYSSWVSREQIAETLHFLLSDKANALREPVLKLYGND